MNRRAMMGSMAAALMGGKAVAQIGPDHPLAAAWSAWKAAHLRPDGRVVDGFQDGASHSEGQGYGMALACTFGDEDAVEAIRRWTDRNLALRDDALLSWRWLPDSIDPVPDRNNASDGDLFLAWALGRAAVRFRQPALADRAAAIARALVATCIAPHPDGSGRLVLLPAAAGFVRDGGLIVNPSYTFPRAMREVAAATGEFALAQAANDGEALMAELAATDAGGSGLVPDWVLLTPGGPRPAPGLSDAAGYEALRVPLFLLWSGAATHSALRGHAAALARAAAAGQSTATVIDRATGAVREVSPHAGYAAIAALAACATAGSAGAVGGILGAAIPPFTASQPYYPATLHLMTLIAQAEGYPQCVPI